MKPSLYQPSFRKKVLSLFLTVLMAFGCVGLLSGVIGNDPFGTKQTASAELLVNNSSIAVEVYNNGIAVYVRYTGSLSYIQAPTWTEYNGQDELKWHNLGAGSWSIGGVSYNYAAWFPLSDHNNEGGNYITHVYINGNVYITGATYNVNVTPVIDRVTAVQNGMAGFYA